MPTTSLVALDRCFRKLDDAYDSALSRKDSAEVSRTYILSQNAHNALYEAVPQTPQDVIVVLKRAIGGIRASDDPLGEGLIPRLRRLRTRLGRGSGRADLQDIIELRDIARVSEAVCDGAGNVPWIAQWLRECAACLGRPQLV